MTVAQLERAAAERGGALCSSSGPAVEQPVAGGHHLQHQGAGGARLLHDVPHVRQVYNWRVSPLRFRGRDAVGAWKRTAACVVRARRPRRAPRACGCRDCGLACVLMLLRGLGVQDIDLRSLCSLCPTTSIWTVDLAYLLRRFGAEVTFCTVTLGANPAFEHEARAGAEPLCDCRGPSLPAPPMARRAHARARRPRTAVSAPFDRCRCRRPSPPYRAARPPRVGPLRASGLTRAAPRCTTRSSSTWTPCRRTASASSDCSGTHNSTA